MNALSAQISWPAAPARLPALQGAVHVFAASLAPGGEALAELHSLLSKEEHERAARFRFDPHRNRFIAARAYLRLILGRYLECDPGVIAFRYSSHGKPELVDASDVVSGEPSERVSDRGSLYFNVAHSDDVGVFAVTRLGRVGIDVECLRPVKDAEALVSRFFSRREAALFHGLTPDVKPIAFFNLWTRKEALLKATGTGISGGLDRVEVSFLPDEPAQLLAVDGSPEQAQGWTLRAFEVAPEFPGAVAVERTGAAVQFWRWTE